MRRVLRRADPHNRHSVNPYFIVIESIASTRSAVPRISDMLMMNAMIVLGALAFMFSDLLIFRFQPLIAIAAAASYMTVLLVATKVFGLRSMLPALIMSPLFFAVAILL